MAYRFQIGDLVETREVFRKEKQIGVIVDKIAYMNDDRETPQRAYIVSLQSLTDESCPEVMFYEYELYLLCPID